MDMDAILGTAVSTPATAGILDVNVKNIDNDAASASGTVTFPNATLASTTNVTAGTITTTTNLTNLPAITANWLTATGINADAFTAAKFADDVSTEFANKVWDTDATGRQTQGTFGQAIGDPAADTNTIYKAVVTDATGSTVGVDVVDLKTQIGTAVSGLTAIDLPDQTMNITGNITGNLSGSVGSVTGNVGGNVVGEVGSVGTAGISSGSLAASAQNAIADAVLDRNMATGADSGTDSTAVRTPRQALRALRNKVTVAAGTATVTKEDDTTTSWTAAITTAAGNPTSGVDPT